MNNIKIIDLNLIESLSLSGRLGNWIRSVNSKSTGVKGKQSKKCNNILDFPLITLLSKQPAFYYMPFTTTTSTATCTVNYYINNSYTTTSMPAIKYPIAIS